MQILILTASLPYPPESGGAIRTYGILRGLHEAGHQVTLLSFHEGHYIDAHLRQLCQHIEVLPPPVRSKRERLLNLLLTHEADIARRFYSEAFKNRLLELIQSNHYDLIQFEAIEAACYLPIARENGTKARLCFDTFNAEAELQRVIAAIDWQRVNRWPAALYSSIQHRRIEAYERSLCQSADGVIAVSPEDAEFLRAYRADEWIYLIPSGIFVDDYTKNQNREKRADSTLVFTGKMDYRPNVDAVLWFAEAIFPRIKSALPQTKLLIVGQKPHPKIEKLADQGGIELTGWVDKVQPYLHNAAVYIAPLRMGSGTRLKLLEAMASGCAIVATTTAASGLLPEARATMKIADEPARFADAIIDLLQNPEKRQQLGDAARSAVQQHYDWSAIIPRLLDVYKDMGLG